MAFSRYTKVPRIFAGKQYGTGNAQSIIRDGIKNNLIGIKKQITLTTSIRLDVLAGIEYDDGRYWWVLAAASDIGWGLQVPPGTVINVPELRDVIRLVG